MDTFTQETRDQLAAALHDAAGSRDAGGEIGEGARLRAVALTVRSHPRPWVLEMAAQTLAAEYHEGGRTA